uniref:Pellino RING domain-containing protein n=1 Tax=Romanomermis culicivorax TaxID=13658 RepID=A0A915J8X9_ROMCU
MVARLRLHRRNDFEKFNVSGTRRARYATGPLPRPSSYGEGFITRSARYRYWSRIPLPHGTSEFIPVCPFCTQKLDADQPFVRLIFQDNCHY